MGKPVIRSMGKKHSRRFLATVEQSRAAIQECDIDEFSSMLNDGEDIVVIDVREQHEYDAGCFKGALHLSKGVIERDIERSITVDLRDLALVELAPILDLRPHLAAYAQLM